MHLNQFQIYDLRNQFQIYDDNEIKISTLLSYNNEDQTYLKLLTESLSITNDTRARTIVTTCDSQGVKVEVSGLTTSPDLPVNPSQLMSVVPFGADVMLVDCGVKNVSADPLRSKPRVVGKYNKHAGRRGFYTASSEHREKTQGNLANPKSVSNERGKRRQPLGAGAKNAHHCEQSENRCQDE
ncbi:hypothetical protein J6590_014093 [Homalodisca vitripennis]|nr:hypothetical protein J6590_014093 [Homalodisca vitripennis]